MAGKVDNSGNSWWSWCCCCGDSASTDDTDREKLKGTGEASDASSGQNKLTGSPQATYSQYRTQVESDPSPMK